MKKLPESRWISLWRHFLDREKTDTELTVSMIEWQEKWHWDFLKINPPACYHVLDWGAEYEFFQDPLREPELRKVVIETVADFDRIGPLDVHHGVLGDQLRVIRNLRSHFGPDLPIVETVFSPIEIAHRVMEGRQALLGFLKSNAVEVHDLLQRITSVFSEFCQECLNAGADGIFFATKWATSDQMTWSEYQEFGTRYEKILLNALQERDALLILHVCGQRTFLNHMLDYPVDIFSYDFLADEAPSPEDVINKTGKFALGGIDPDLLERNVQRALEVAFRYTGLSQWLAGPSCVVSPRVPDANIRKIKDGLKA
jgi:uroporphyrinogen decarboxylase